MPSDRDCRSPACNAGSVWDWAAGWFAHPGHERTLFWLWLATAWPLSFVGTFFNVALVAAAAAAFDGRRLSLRQALAVSVRRLGPIAFWSLLASTVGALLRVLAERLPLGGRLAAVVLGASWSVLTLLAVPVLALEGCSAVDCLPRSTELVKRRRGEGISGAVIISAWVVVATLSAGLLLGFAVQMEGAARSALLAIAIVGVILIAGARCARSSRWRSTATTPAETRQPPSPPRTSSTHSPGADAELDRAAGGATLSRKWFGELVRASYGLLVLLGMAFHFLGWRHGKWPAFTRTRGVCSDLPVDNWLTQPRQNATKRDESARGLNARNCFICR